MRFHPLSETFARFAEKECKGSSRLYEVIAREIANDHELLQLANEAGKGQPAPNLLFGSVHYLLLKGANHSLRNYYASLKENPENASHAFPAFKEFCRKEQKKIIPLITNKRVQTNEVNRCAYLYPGFCYIYQKAKKPLSLIEIGTSAGLQLLWDEYSYSYGTRALYGNKRGDVILRTEMKGERLPLLLPESPPVASKTGVDLHINQLSDPEDLLWLKALIWPEHEERRELFESAAAAFNRKPVPLVQGDGVELLEVLAEKVPSESALCIFHTHVANQMPPEVKERLLKAVRRLGEKREIYHLYNNIQDRDLHLDSFVNGIETNETLAETDGHGRWFRWLL